MRMRQLLWSGVGLACGFSSLSAYAADQREVIASSQPASSASLGTPVAISAVQPKVRAQKDDKSSVPPPLASPTPSTDGTSNILPYPNAMPPAGQSGVPLSTTTPMPSSGPPMNYAPSGYDLGTTMTPGGVFNCEPSHTYNRWYVNGEYLHYWLRDAGLPPLVTTGSPQSATVIESGNLNRTIDPNTQVLFGNAPIDNQGRSGAKFEIGRWFGANRPWAIEFGGFFVGDRSISYHADSSQITPLSRPIIVANIPREGVDNFAQPGILAGSIDINGNSSFYGANADWRRRLWCGCRFNVDGLLGFRYLNYDENINIIERSQVIADNVVAPNLNNAPIPRGLQNIITDSFKVDNDFFGGTLGLQGSYQLGRFSLDMGTKVSLGTTHERLDIAGNQVIVYPDGQRFPFAGGLLARPSNIGSYSQNKFAVVPEVNFGVGYQMTNHLKVSLGYDFIYWSNVLRVGDQIDRSVNINGIPYFPQTNVRGNTDPVTNGPIPPGPARPAVLLKETDFWAQGINVGLLWTW